MTIRPAAVPDLSVEEREILAGIAQGSYPITVASGLGLSLQTVTACLARAGRKLGTWDHAGMVHVAYLAEQLPRPKPSQTCPALSSDQLRIIRLRASGKALDTIAEELDRAPRQLGGEFREAQFILCAESEAHLVTRGWEYGLLDRTEGQVS